MKRLFGTGVALVTPFDELGKIDFKGLKKLLIHTAKSVDYFVVMGTTGESATLSKEEKKSVLKFVVENNPKKLPIKPLRRIDKFLSALYCNFIFFLLI